MSWPSMWPVFRSKEVMWPSPNVADQQSAAEGAEVAGGQRQAPGELSDPPVTSRLSRKPLVLYTSMTPLPAPAHVRRAFSAFCLA